ncbi:MAG: hypothetical protein ACE5HE_07965 [Phycisphaerae bacterium]
MPTSSLAQRAADPTPFERYVPASTKLYVAIRQLREVDAAMHRAHAWRLLPILGGASAGHREGFDLRAAVASLVGNDHTIEVDELMRAEVGIVASSWTKLGSAVWLVRVSRAETLDEWFPRRMRRMSGVTGDLVSFRTRGGMDVCVRGDVAAMTRRTRRDSPLRDVRRLMQHEGDDSLDRSDMFRDLVSYLPGRCLATVYLSRNGPRTANGDGGSGLWPELDRAAVGLYEHDGRIDLALRASLTKPQKLTPLEDHGVLQLMRLPQTTLFALATTMDFDRVYSAAMSNPSRSVWNRYLAILTGLARHASHRSQTGTGLGPHVVFAWGQDLSEEGSSPQVALMVECRSAQALRAEVTRIAGNLVKLAARTNEPAPEVLPTIQRELHLGTLVEHVPLGPYAAQRKSGMASLLGGADPAWAAWRNWFIIALSRDHLERILDAQTGLIPTIAAVADARELQERHAARSSVALAQPALAADVLDRWIKDYEEGSPSALGPSWWANPPGLGDAVGARLGVVLRADKERGVIVVADVPAQSPAQGHLQVGDLVLGIDGHLLGLRSPGSDLQEWLMQNAGRPEPILRIQRGGRMLDVGAPWASSHGGGAPQYARPVDAVRELATLGRGLRLATFSVHAADEMRYSALLTLRFYAEAPQ